MALVRRVYELFNRLHDEPELGRELMAHFAEDVEFVQAEGPPDAGRHVGRRAMAAAWEDWLSVWREHRTTSMEVRESGDRVLVLSHERFLPREGMEIENDGASIFTIRGGRIVRLEGFIDQQAAIEAFGP